MAGRLTAVLSGLDVDLGPGGWRLADSSDAAHRRARALLTAVATVAGMVIGRDPAPEEELELLADAPDGVDVPH